jgi:hypothetical protein
MTYQQPHIEALASTKTLVQGVGHSDKRNGTCRDGGGTNASSVGAYEADE